MAEAFIPSRNGESFERRFRDTQLAEDFRVIADLTEACGQHGERALLQLSTCRNLMMTVNAVFVDIRDVVGASTTPSPLGRGIHHLSRHELRDADRSLRDALRILAVAGQKLNVWDDRAALAALIVDALDGFRQADRDRIRRLLGLDTVRGGVKLGLRSTDYDVTASVPYAEDLLVRLRRHRDRLSAIAHTLLEVVVALNAEPREQSAEALFELPETPEEQARRKTFENAITGLSEELTREPWNAVVEPPRVVVYREFGSYDLTSATDLRNLGGTLADQSGGWLTDCREDLKREFAPNVARPPMPAPYVIDLTAPVNGAASILQVERVHGDTPSVAGTIRVAAMRCGIPESWYEEQESAYQIKPSSADLLIDVTRDAIRRAAAAGAQMLVLPEVFLPSSAVGEVTRLAREVSIIVVGGVEMHRDRHGVVNRAIVALPSGGVHEQRKQRPSVYEVRASEFADDGLMRVFRSTAVGTFAVMICSDYLEQDLTSTIDSDGHIGLHVVCSRNPNPEVFRHLAAADAYRRYGHVVISNARPDHLGSPASGEGTLAATPERTNPFVDPAGVVPLGYTTEFEPHEPPALAIFEFSAEAIAHRNHVRSDPGYLSAPNFARRP